MHRQFRQERSVFLLFLGACFVALMAALPIVIAQTQVPAKKEPEAKTQSAASGASAAASDFERADRNRDGFVDKSEAAVVPGLSANFERADRSRDGKLDPQEFAKGLEILQVRR
jgi:EF hand